MPKGPVSIARGRTGRKLAPEIYPDFTGPEELSERFRNTVPSWRARRKGHGCVVRSRSMRRQ